MGVIEETNVAAAIEFFRSLSLAERSSRDRQVPAQINCL